jgi:hypothetical protein
MTAMVAVMKMREVEHEIVTGFEIFLDKNILLLYIAHTQTESIMKTMQFTFYRFYFSWGYWWRQSAIGGLHSDRKSSRVS